jgi:dihydrofolate synthase/folylpolyglutamate synthase
LLSACVNPDKYLNTLQIIGTNGKGSTAASLSSILIASGLKVGMYTSPHLVDLSERITINNNTIDNHYINHFINLFFEEIKELHCTFFETLTVMAAYFFKENEVDVAIFETGLGGRFDSVTACNAKLQLFTKISMDHSHILGNTITEIATDKAEAIHHNAQCLSVKQQEAVQNILINKAKEKGANINFNLDIYDDQFEPPLLGKHQQENIMLAIKAAKHITNLTDHDIKTGIKKISWPGRIELLSKTPNIFFDVSHNDDSIIAFCNTIESFDHRGINFLIISIQKTKQINKAILKLKSIFSKIIITQINDRMYSSKDLSSMFAPHSSIEIINNPNHAIKETMAKLNKPDILGIIGSHYWGEYIYQNF